MKLLVILALVVFFIEEIEVPEDLTTFDEQENYMADLDKSDIMSEHELHGIVDFYRYVKKVKSTVAKKPTWKDVANKWEKACSISEKSASIWEKNATEWKSIALKYREFIEFKFPHLKLEVEPIEIAPTEKLVEPKKDSISSNEPVDITNGYSGGWLAPNGDFYGMDKEYNDMIHNQLADKIKELGLIPADKDRWHNPDSWLSDNGWTKIHDGCILYDGYQRAKRELPVIKMTDEQRKQIALYGTKCCDGVLNVGLNKKRLTPTMFLMVETPMLWKLFDF